MAPREDVVNSAVAFLQDPANSTSPLERRIAFLQSKNLTAEEIQVALARTGEDPAASFPPQSQANYYATPQRGAPPSGYTYNYGYGSYPGLWPPQQMQEPPRRDWRDWFIMATVTTGLGWGLYTVAKRYVAPLILPPTPPQIEQDKESIDASFKRAFALIDQISTDTTALKEAENQREEKLDKALTEVSSVVEELKRSSRIREDDSRNMADDLTGLRPIVEEAINGWNAKNDQRLKELGVELNSLKMLVGQRLGIGAALGQSQQPQSQLQPQYRTLASSSSGSTTPTGTGSANSGFAPSTSGLNEKVEQSTAASSALSVPSSSATPAPGATAPRQARAIPAWQRAANTKSSEEAASSSGANKSTEDGALSAPAPDVTAPKRAASSTFPPDTQSPGIPAWQRTANTSTEASRENAVGESGSS